MDSMRDFFVAEVRVGNKVSVMLAKGQEHVGTVDSMKDDIFTIKLEDGRIKPIAYIGIANYDVLDASVEAEPFSDLTEKLEDEIENQAITHTLNIEKLKEEIKKEDPDFKKAISPLIESFNNAVKIKETSPKFGRISKIIFGINELAKAYPKNTILKEILGEIYFCTEEYEKSQEQFALANKFREALAVSELTEKKESQLAYCIRYLLDSHGFSPDIYNLLAKLTYKYDDLSGLIELCRRHENALTPESVQALCPGMIYILRKYNKRPVFKDTQALFTADNFNSLFEQILDIQSSRNTSGVMDLVNQLGQTVDMPSDEKTETSKDEWKTGTITSYSSDKMFGFIDKTFFFHLNHIIDDNLRYKLSNTYDNNCMVKFRMGQNAHGECAVDLKLYDEPVIGNTINIKPASTEEHKGFIEYYDADQEFGKIQCGDNQYGFKLYNVSDRYLQAKLNSDFYLGEIDVTFKHSALPNGKTGACEIYALHEFSDADKKYYDAIIAREERSKRISVNRRAIARPNPAISANRVINKNNGYYNQARRTWEKGDHDEALVLYQKAIDYSDKPESAVGDMVSIYLKKNEPEKAESLLEKYKTLLEEDKRDNLFIMVYDKLKKYENLLKLLDKVIQSTDKINTKLHYTFRKAKILSDTPNCYKQAIDTYRQWEKIKNSNRALLGITGNGSFNPYSMMEIEAKRGMAICYSQLEDTVEAKKLANELIRVNKNDELALAILEDRFSSYILHTESLITNENEFISINEYLSDIMMYRLASFDLVSVLDIRKAKDGRYIGRPEDAVFEVERLEGVSTQEPQKRSTWCLAAAKIITQFIDDEYSDKLLADPKVNKSVFSVKRRNDLLAKSLVSDGDYSMLSSGIPMDVARFYYQESIKLLETDKQDAQNAVVRYIASYFVDRTEIPISMEGSKNVHINKTLANYFRFLSIKGVNGFVNACIALFINNASVKKQLIRLLFDCEKLKVQTASYLMQICGDNSPKNTVTYDDYCEIWDSAIMKFKDYEKRLKSFMNSLSEFSFNSLWINTALEDMAQLEFMDFMFDLDKIRFNKVKEILKNAERYNKATDFETRDDALNEIVNTCSELAKEIPEHPTKYAFEILIPVISVFRDATKPLLEKLYEDFKPKVSVDLVNKNVVVPEGKTTIGLQLCIKNEKNMQAADGLKIVFIDNDRYWVNGDVICKRGYVKGGESETVFHELNLSNQALLEKAFSLNIQLEYNYKSLEEGRETQSKQFEFSINLVDDQEFQSIDNPYSAYTQSGEVYDPNMFFGRKQILTEIVGNIKKSDGELLRKKSIILFGQKRTGKSTILYHLKDKIRKESKNSIVVDMGNIAQLITDMGTENIMRSFQFQLLSKLRDELEDFHHELLEALNENGIIIPINEMLDPSKMAGPLFIKFFNDFNRYAKGMYNIVVLIDEFSYLYSWIEEGKLSKDFMKFWKAIVQSCEIVGILVGQDYMLDFINSYPNEFGSTQSEKITYLSADAAKELIYKPISLIIDGKPESRYKEGAIERIMDLTAGSAYYIMIICDKLVEYLNEERQIYVTDAYVNKLVDNKLLRGNNMLDEAKFDPLFNDEGHIEDKTRKEDNLEILKIIAQKSQTSGKCLITDIKSHKLEEKRLALLLDSLEYRDVIEKVDGKYMKIKVGLFKEWLINRYGGDE